MGLYVASEVYVPRAKRERFGGKAFDIESQLVRADLYRKGELS